MESRYVRINCFLFNKYLFSGVLLFVVLIGRYPFYDTTPQGLFTRIRTGQFAIPVESQISYSARALIHGLLRRDPTERPQAETLLALPWLSSTKRCLSSNYSSTNVVRVGRKGASISGETDDQIVPFVELTATITTSATSDKC